MLTFLIRLIRWRMGWSDAKESPRVPALPYVPEYEVPDLERIQNPDPKVMQITWVGHATFLIQIAGKNILTDPIWSERASPVSFMGPKRFARPGIDWKDLPSIDICLISHTHYDHLDRPTIKKLGAKIHYILPTNVAKWFAGLGITNTTELSWWKSEKIDDLTITSVPANHWSKRNLWGTSDAGWGGYIIESSVGTIYFAGDTGAHKTYFKEIGERFPNIDVGLIPIGAYYPQWIFGRYHVDPNDALKIHREVGAKKSIGMHWAVFKLTEEPLDEPPKVLKEEVEKAGLPADQFTTIKIGETRVFKNFVP